MGLFKFGPASMAGVSGAMDYWTKQRDDEAMRQREMADWQNKQTFANNQNMQNWQKQNETQQKQQVEAENRAEKRAILNYKAGKSPIWQTALLSGEIDPNNPDSETMKRLDAKDEEDHRQKLLHDPTSYLKMIDEKPGRHVKALRVKYAQLGQLPPYDEYSAADEQDFQEQKAEKQAKLDAENKIGIQPGPQGSDIVTRGKSMTVVRQPAPQQVSVFSATPQQLPSGQKGWTDNKGYFHPDPIPKEPKPKSVFSGGGGGSGNGPGTLPPLSGSFPKGPTPRGGQYGARGGAHGGLDIDVPDNTPIPAEMNGTVTAVHNTNTGKGGRYVSVKYSDGTTRSYMHLSKAGVTLGQKVSPDSILGLSGHSGDATGPHIHIQIRDAKGNKIDPTPYYGGQQRQPTQTTEQAPMINGVPTWIIINGRKMGITGGTPDNPVYGKDLTAEEEGKQKQTENKKAAMEAKYEAKRNEFNTRWDDKRAKTKALYWKDGKWISPAAHDAYLKETGQWFKANWSNYDQYFDRDPNKGRPNPNLKPTTPSYMGGKQATPQKGGKKPQPKLAKQKQSGPPPIPANLQDRIKAVGRQ